MIETIYSDPNYLAHYGVKGMHWGVRRYQNEDGSLTSAGKLRAKAARYGSEALQPRGKKGTSNYASQLGEHTRNVGRDTARLIDKIIPDAKPEPLDLSGMSDQELRNRINRIQMERTYASLVQDPNLNARKQRVIRGFEIVGDIGQWTVSAALAGLTIYKIRHSDHHSNELYHYGVKGMKWGVRKAIENAGNSARNRFNTGLTDKQKHRLKVAAGVTAVTAVAGIGVAMAVKSRNAKAGAVVVSRLRRRLAIPKTADGVWLDSMPAYYTPAKAKLPSSVRRGSRITLSTPAPGFGNYTTTATLRGSRQSTPAYLHPTDGGYIHVYGDRFGAIKRYNQSNVPNKIARAAKRTRTGTGAATPRLYKTSAVGSGSRVHYSSNSRRTDINRVMVYNPKRTTPDTLFRKTTYRLPGGNHKRLTR